MDHLATLPRDTQSVRALLFSLPLPFSLTLANHKLCWLLVDNVYSIRKSRAYARARITTHYVACPLMRDTSVSITTIGVTKAVNRRAKSCDIEFKIIEFVDHVEYHWITDDKRANHGHLLDESDATKQNSLLKGLVGVEVMRGIPAS